MMNVNFENKPPLLSTSYYPPIEYIARIVKHEGALIELFETYPKQTWRNRCRIMTANGIQDLTIPVNKPNGRKTITSEIKIFNDNKWQLIHSRALHSAYSGSPYYLYYMDNFEGFFTNHYENLVELNTAILSTILGLLKFNFLPTFTKDFIIPGSSKNDFRYTISPKQEFDKNIFERYYQVFSDRHPFHENLSILDLIFNLGPESRSYLLKVAEKLDD